MQTSEDLAAQLVKVREQLIRERARERKRNGWTNPAVDGLTTLYAALKHEHSEALDAEERARRDAFFAERLAAEAAKEEERRGWLNIPGRGYASMSRNIWDPAGNRAHPNTSSLARDGFSPWRTGR